MIKNTPLKKAVLDLFTRTKEPLSVPQILEQLDKHNLRPNKSSLYRLLKKLADHKEVQEVLLDSQISYFELNRHHHHHFVCKNCENVTCINDPDFEKSVTQLSQRLHKQGLRVLKHDFFLSGNCLNCQ